MSSVNRQVEKAALEFQKTHCSNCTTDIPPGKPGRLCPNCKNLHDRGDKNSLAIRREHVIKAKVKAAESQEQKVVLEHVHLDLAEGGRIVERTPEGFLVRVFGGDDKLEAMVKAVVAGPIPQVLAYDIEQGTPFLPTEEIVTRICDFSQVLLDECQRRRLAKREDNEQSSDKQPEGTGRAEETSD